MKSGRKTAQQEQGEKFEQRALEYLVEAGLIPVARNLRYRAGELDLILMDRSVLVFVEVRSREGNGWGGAGASIDVHKQRRLIHAAQIYLQQRYGNRPPACRFDVVIFDGGGKPEWLRDAIAHA